MQNNNLDKIRSSLHKIVATVPRVKMESIRAEVEFLQGLFEDQKDLFEPRKRGSHWATKRSSYTFEVHWSDGEVESVTLEKVSQLTNKTVSTIHDCIRRGRQIHIRDSANMLERFGSIHVQKDPR